MPDNVREVIAKIDARNEGRKRVMDRLALLLVLLPLAVSACPVLDPGLYTQDIWTQTGPEYFSLLPEAYGVPNNFADAPGSWIIPDTPTPPTEPAPWPAPVLFPADPLPAHDPDPPAVPEPGSFVLVGGALLILARIIYVSHK